MTFATNILNQSQGHATRDRGMMMMDMMMPQAATGPMRMMRM